MALIVTIDNGQGEVDYSNYVVAGSISIEDGLNVPTLIGFTLVNNDRAFVVPSRSAYVRIYSKKFERPLATGVISNNATVTPLGVAGNAPEFSFLRNAYQIPITSDEYWLNVKTIPYLPAMENRTQGEILTTLAEALKPQFYDSTTFVASGALVPHFEYDPNKSWSDIAKEFGDASNYRYKVLDRTIYFQPIGDLDLGISYDDTKKEATFDPYSLQLGITTIPATNEVFIIGDIEPQNSADDYFIGDGFTGNFPLKHKAFEGESANLLQEDWTGTSMSTDIWFESDPLGVINLPGGSLNILGGGGNLNETYILCKNGLELGGQSNLQHGEVVFNDSGAGIIGGLYNTSSLLLDTTCEAGFDIRPSASVVVSFSGGASGLLIQPMRLGALIGPQVVTKHNHHYFLQTIVAARRSYRYNQVFRSLNGQLFGGDQFDSTAEVTWLIQDIDLANPGSPQNTRYTQTVQLPQIGYYAPINSKNLNITLNFTLIALPPQGTLQVASLVGASGGQLPTRPVGAEQQYLLGFGFQNQTATLSEAGDVTQLQFYSDSLPAVGARIRLQTWAEGTAVARVRDSNAVTNEAKYAGDDGVRSGIITDLKPLPRTSEEAERAGQALLADRETLQLQGSYTVHGYFFTGDADLYPIVPGRYFSLNSPSRKAVNQKLLVTKVITTVEEMYGEELVYSISFGTDLQLEKYLKTFVDRSTTSALQPKTSNLGRPDFQTLPTLGGVYIDDLPNARLTSITGTSVTFDLGQVPITGCEVRRTDANGIWGQDSKYLIGVFNTKTFTLPRTAYEQTWYLRQTFNGKYQRFSKKIRVVYPLIPNPPSLLSADSRAMQLDFAGDIRNIYGVEIRVPTTTIINAPGATITTEAVVTSRVVTTPADLYFDLRALGAFGVRTFNAYFFNLLYEYSTALVINIPAPDAPVLVPGNKMATHIEMRIDHIPRTDINYTTYQLAADANFSVGVISVTGQGQPATFNTIVPSASGSFFARAKRSDYIGDGLWSLATPIPSGNLISSNWSVGQGGIPPTIDDQVTALFTYVSTANAGGGANSGKLVTSWVNFNIVFADGTFQLIPTGSLDTGFTLTSSTSATTPYYFYPRAKAGISGSPVEWVGTPKAHAAKSPADAAACLADGYIALAGSTLSITENVAVAPASSGSGSGGGGGGGAGCVPVTEMVWAPWGNMPAGEVQVRQLLKGADPLTGSYRWSNVIAVSFSDERCVEVMLGDDGPSSFSVSTPIPVWKKKKDGGFEFLYVYGRELNGSYYMMNRQVKIVPITGIRDLGYQRVAHISLSPTNWYFAGSGLTHNLPIFNK